MANESYEDFARALQTEYEEDCGVTFGKVPLTALAQAHRVVDGEEQPIGREAAEVIREALVEQKMLDADGRIQPAFDPKKPGLQDRPARRRSADLAPAVIDLLASYQIERHIRQDQDEGPNRLKKEVQLSPEFQALWDRIKPKTTYRVEFETDDAGPPRRRCHQADGEDRGAEDPRQRGTARRQARRHRDDRRQRRRGARRLGCATRCPTSWPTCRTRPN